MQQLSGLDAAFLYLESGSTPMHIGSLALYDQSTAPGGQVGFKDILAYYRERLHKSSCFRRRAVRVPLGLDHPFWIEDPEFDLEFHVRHIALPSPGDWRQLCIQVARLHARPLDTARPLWEVYVIEGLHNIPDLPEGSFAVVSKIHHSAIDGVSGARIAAAVHDLSPDAPIEPPAQSWTPDRYPSDVELLARSALHAMRQPLRVARLAVNAAPALVQAGMQILKRETAPPGSAPRTRFNGRVSPNRVFEARSFQLADIARIKAKVAGATVNDVVLAICGGALRKYLLEKDELPDESLVAMAPVSVRPESQRQTGGNKVSLMRLPVHSEIALPLERLQAVHAASSEAKRVASAAGPGLLTEAAELLPALASELGAQIYATGRLAERLPPVFNTVITNVPGAKVPLYSMGARLLRNYGLGPIYDGLGLFQPILSCEDRISISAVSCRSMMPDPAYYARCLQDSFDELAAATKPAARKTAPRRTRSSKPPVSRDAADA